MLSNRDLAVVPGVVDVAAAVEALFVLPTLVPVARTADDLNVWIAGATDG
jgi:hypothetical protein